MAVQTLGQVYTATAFQVPAPQRRDSEITAAAPTPAPAAAATTPGAVPAAAVTVGATSAGELLQVAAPAADLLPPVQEQLQSMPAAAASTVEAEPRSRQSRKRGARPSLDSVTEATEAEAGGTTGAGVSRQAAQTACRGRSKRLQLSSEPSMVQQQRQLRPRKK